MIEMDITDLTTKLSGVILRKAEIENNFEKVYSKVFEKMVEIEAVGSAEFLEIFGDMGG